MTCKSSSVQQQNTTEEPGYQCEVLRFCKKYRFLKVRHRKEGVPLHGSLQGEVSRYAGGLAVGLDRGEGLQSVVPG